MFLAWIIVGTIVAGIELTLWTMFRRKLSGLDFPHDIDQSHLRFFTRNSLKLITLLQAVFLIAVFVIASFFLW